MHVSESVCQKRLLSMVFGAAVLALAASPSAKAAGPGDHWIDTLPAGVDIMPAEAHLGIDTDLNGVPDFNVLLTGPMQQNRSDPKDDSLTYPGTRALDGHLDVIDTELVSMSLTGGGWTLRAGTGQGLATASYGNIAEQPGDAAWGDAFFDVFFEIDGTPSGTIHNKAALRIEAEVDRMPYAAIFDLVLAQPLPLYDTNDEHVANLTNDLKAGRLNHPPDVLEQFTAVDIPVGRVPVAEILAYIAQPCSPQHRVHHRVQHHVGVAVPDQPLVRGNLHPGQHQPASRRQTMDIIALPYARYHAHNRLSQITAQLTLCRAGHARRLLLVLHPTGGTFLRSREVVLP